MKPHNHKKRKRKKKRRREKREERKKITGIIICVDFSVFLKETLPFSKQLLDDLYIITSDDDIKTKKLCEETNTKCLSIPRTKPIFLKGIYINHSFDNIPHEGWFLITDADIVLPLKNELDISQIEERPECLYGAYCQYCYSYDEWIDYRDNGIIYNWKIRCRTKSVGMGALQLFHTDHFKKRDNCRYPPYTVKTFGRKRPMMKGCDHVFSNQFSCSHKLLSFRKVLHLSDKRNIKDKASRLYENIIVFGPADT